MRLSIIIPSNRGLDPYLNPTVEDLLKNSELGNEMEIIVVLDGGWTAPVDDPRVKVLHLGKNRGMRDAINAGVLISTGEYIMRIDEHSTVCPGYDRILLEDIEDNWIVTLKRYFLDTEKWEVMDVPPVDICKLIIDETHKKFSGVPWRSRSKEFKDEPIVETMAMQGSMWCMKRTWWDQVIGKLDTKGYGPLYGDSHEMVFKSWRVGGKLMVNKKGWHSHKHRQFNRTHSYSSADARPGWDYSINTWGEYYNSTIKPLWKI